MKILISFSFGIKDFQIHFHDELIPDFNSQFCLMCLCMNVFFFYYFILFCNQAENFKGDWSCQKTFIEFLWVWPRKNNNIKKWHLVGQWVKIKYCHPFNIKIPQSIINKKTSLIGTWNWIKHFYHLVCSFFSLLSFFLFFLLFFLLKH